MFKALSVPLLSAALALSPVAAVPARADEDLGKVLAGVALLAIIGSALSDSQAATPAPVHPPKSHVSKRPLPEECRHEIRERGRMITVYGKQCLDRHMRRSARLPDTCEREIQVFGREHDVYPEQCLRRHGWPV